MSVELLHISAVVATRNRAAILQRTLESVAKQSSQPVEIMIVDASDGIETQMLCDMQVAGLSSKLRWIKATERGAGAQRNQGVATVTEAMIWFFDDDIVFEPHCAERLWKAIESDRQLGGVNAMIANQQYHPPGFVSRVMFTLVHGKCEESFAGRVIGPAINLLPEDREELPEIVPVEWLNTTCTIYRREALPTPAFDAFFKGYSLMEDLALSLRVGKTWKLANVRDARIVHDSQTGEHKRDTCELAEMEVLNRHYVMTKLLLRNGAIDHLKLLMWELFQLTACAIRSDTRKSFLPTLRGKFRAAKQIVHNG